MCIPPGYCRYHQQVHEVVYTSIPVGNHMSMSSINVGICLKHAWRTAWQESYITCLDHLHYSLSNTIIFLEVDCFLFWTVEIAVVYLPLSSKRSRIHLWCHPAQDLWWGSQHSKMRRLQKLKEIKKKISHFFFMVFDKLPKALLNIVRTTSVKGCLGCVSFLCCFPKTNKKPLTYRRRVDPGVLSSLVQGELILLWLLGLMLQQKVWLQYFRVEREQESFVIICKRFRLLTAWSSAIYTHHVNHKGYFVLYCKTNLLNK